MTIPDRSSTYKNTENIEPDRSSTTTNTDKNREKNRESIESEKSIVVIPAEKVSVKAGRSTSHRKLRVAAYCRVSTDEEKQLDSFDNQVDYFTKLIDSNKKYELAAIYSDEGISGCSTRRRSGFRSMIQACEEGKIDLIITKSISRFARNTQDSLNYTRKLKDMGIGICFEKEGINTLESSGELLLTLFSCFAQEESRSISENTSWGIRSKFRQGIPHLNAKVLLGYDKDESGNLVINQEQADIVRRIYREFLEGFSLTMIAGRLNKDGVPGVYGRPRWCANTISRILSNEKYKGALLMQKTFTANYLTKQCLKNTGQLNQYYVEHAHPAIIDPELWEAAQQEIIRRQTFIREHNLRGMFGAGADSPFYARLFCAHCSLTMQRVYHKGVSKPYWSCIRCGAQIAEEDLRSKFCSAFNHLVQHRSDIIQHDETPLEKLRTRQILDITAGGTIPYEVPELTRTILQEARLHEDNNITFTLLSGDKVKIGSKLGQGKI